MKSIPQYIHYMYSYPHKTAYRTFDVPVNLSTYLNKVENKDATLYFHIPFCRYKCGFCNLFSRQGYNEQLISSYLDAMNRQARQLSALTKKIRFTSFAIGGGTPLILNKLQLKQLLEIASLFNVDPQHTFTSIETSPSFADEEILEILAQKGVKRMSIGIQSFDPAELRAVKRNVPVGTCLSALETIKKLSFPQFNIDLIYGIEGQTMESFLDSVRQALSYDPTELFLYPLYVRQGVQIHTKERNELLYKMYLSGRDELMKQGFKQTSMRRFVRDNTLSNDPEYSCGDETVISCGCGGRSYMDNLHYATPYAVEQNRISDIIGEYITTSDFTQVHTGYILSEDEQKRRFIIKNLMYYRGLDKKEYRERFGEEPEQLLFDNLKNKGFIYDSNGFIRLTPIGMAFSDDIGQQFISQTVRKKMTEYSLQ